MAIILCGNLILVLGNESEDAYNCLIDFLNYMNQHQSITKVKGRNPEIQMLL